MIIGAKILLISDTDKVFQRLFHFLRKIKPITLPHNI